MKDVLKALWKMELLKDGEREIVEEIKASKEQLKTLEKEGLIEKIRGRYKLTEKGRGKIKIVVCGGVFDVLHPGHGFVLEKAKEYGDLLIVIVARDSTVRKRKRTPIVPEEQRLEMVRYLKPVDVAVLGKIGDFLSIIKDIKPDIIALGPDQTHDEKHIKEELERRGIKVEIRKIKEYKKCPLHSTKSILREIIKRGYPESSK